MASRSTDVHAKLMRAAALWARLGASVLRVHAGAVKEIGIVERSLTGSASQSRYLFSHL